MTTPQKKSPGIVVLISAVLIAIIILAVTVFLLLTTSGSDAPQYKRFDPIRAPQAAAEAHGGRREGPGR